MRTLPPEPRPGEKVSATLLREIIRAIRERTPISGHGIKLSTGPNGTVFSSESGSLTLSSDIKPFSCRYVNQDSIEGIPYSGWEIYLPDGCVCVNVTAKPMNPRAYRMVGSNAGGNETPVRQYLEGWYRMPEEELDQYGKFVVIRVKCNSAVSGVDEISDWPVCHLWAEVCRSSVRSHGDVISEIVGEVRYSTSGESTVRSYRQTVDSPIITTASTNGNFELLHEFEVDSDEVSLELEKIYVMNPSFAAAGRTFDAGGTTGVMEGLTEIDKDAEYVYLKVDTQTGTASLKTFSETEGGDSINTQVLQESTDFVLMIRLYQMEDGVVVYDNRRNLNNVQIYK